VCVNKFLNSAWKLSLYLFAKIRMLTQVLHGNCRTLSLATIVSKLLEHYILSCISLFPATTKKIRTWRRSMCIFTQAASTILRKQKHQSVCSCFSWIQGILQNQTQSTIYKINVPMCIPMRHVPMCTVRLLVSWYRYHTIPIKWETCFSDPFTVANAVRQDGVPGSTLIWNKILLVAIICII